MMDALHSINSSYNEERAPLITSLPRDFDDSPDADDKNDSITNGSVIQTTIYTRRWVVLAVFMFLSIMNNLTQYSFSPITQVTKGFYTITDTEVNLLAVVFMITGFTTRFVAMWIMDNKGLGYGVFISASLNVVGGWLRYFPGGLEDHMDYFWLLSGQTLCAVAQSFIDIAGPKIAANWFPPKERTTATALSQGPIFLALLIAYATVPRVVTEQNANEDFPIYLLIEALLSTLATALTFAIFRGEPPIPPSYSAASDKLKFADAFKILFKNLNFVLMFIVFAVTLGSALAFSVLMEQIIGPSGYTTTDASTLAIVWISFAILGGFIGGPIIDRTRAYKAFILVTLILSALSIIVFTLVLSYTEKNLTALCVIIAFVGLGSAAAPAILEATIETIYPVPEASAMGILFLGLNITAVVFVLGMGKLKNPKTGSMAGAMWTIVACCFVSIICVIFFKPNYQRLEYEAKKQREQDRKIRSSNQNFT